MFTIIAIISDLISCREYLLRGKKGKIVSPSQLDSIWLRQSKNLEIKIIEIYKYGHKLYNM